LIRSVPHPALGATAVHRIAVVLRLLTALVWFHLVAIFAYAVVAAVSVGHWPRYGRPDPKDLELPVVHAVVFLSHYVFLWAAVAWLVCAPFFLVALGTRHVRWKLAWYVAGVILTVLNFVQDPVGVSDWFAD
jgi:hypothetical protein